MVDQSLRAYRLRRWGLYWIVTGFLALTLNLVKPPEIIFFILAGLLLGIIQPKSELWHRHWIWRILISAGTFALFILIFFILSWVSVMYHLDLGILLTMVSLAIGIALQVWAEILWHPDLTWG
jgi:hypothetical protein